MGQRLVALAMNLGMAKAQTATVEEAHEAIAEAHEETKAALAELRNLIRGLHPPVLENRGLDPLERSEARFEALAQAFERGSLLGDRIRRELPERELPPQRGDQLTQLRQIGRRGLVG